MEGKKGLPATPTLQKNLTRQSATKIPIDASLDKAKKKKSPQGKKTQLRTIKTPSELKPSSPPFGLAQGPSARVRWLSTQKKQNGHPEKQPEKRRTGTATL